MPLWTALLSLLLALSPQVAHAVFLHGETLDTAADYLALFVIFVVPVGVLYLFWLIHILPEKIAEKNHHPQKSAIKTLCLLSLVFGGMLWPFAWLWAYSKPVIYKAAYGTDKHEDYYIEAAEKAESGEAPLEHARKLREELDALAKQGKLTPELQHTRDRLAAVEAEAAAEAKEEAR
jgi:Protein of unknown function (DUF3302)